MIRDHIAYILVRQNELIQALKQKEGKAKDRKLGKQEKEKARQQAEKVRHQLLQQKQSDPSTIYLFLDTTGEADSNAFRDLWQQKNKRKNITTKVPQALHQCVWHPPGVDIELFPLGSFFITFDFTLQQPLLTRDENDFYIIENPVRRDRISNLPYVAASSWKGNLASALWKSNHRRHQPEIDPRVVRLFGSDKDKPDEEPNQAGRLQFFPTFFDKVSLEIINPHDRRTRTGKNPIPIEAVPENSDGTFSLLYVPFQSSGFWDDSQQGVRREVAEDLILVSECLQAMFRVYGFSAKRTSGFGIAKEEILPPGSLAVRFDRPLVSDERTSTKYVKDQSPQPVIRKPFESFETLKNVAKEVAEITAEADDEL